MIGRLLIGRLLIGRLLIGRLLVCSAAAGAACFSAASAGLTCPQIPIADDGDETDDVYVYEAFHYPDGAPGCNPVYVTTVTGDFPAWEYACGADGCIGERCIPCDGTDANDPAAPPKPDPRGSGGRAAGGGDAAKPAASRKPFVGLPKAMHPDGVPDDFPAKNPHHAKDPRAYREKLNRHHWIVLTTPGDAPRTVLAKAIEYRIKDMPNWPARKRLVTVAYEVTHFPEGQNLQVDVYPSNMVVPSVNDPGVFLINGYRDQTITVIVAAGP